MEIQLSNDESYTLLELTKRGMMVGTPAEMEAGFLARMVLKIIQAADTEQASREA